MTSPRREGAAPAPRSPRSPRAIPADAAERVAQHFGRELTFTGWPHGQSMMWRATDGRDPAGSSLYVKVHSVPYLHDRHSYAFDAWVPHLPCATPELLLSDASLRLMVFAELPGQPLELVDLGARAELEAYATAGRVARAYHEIPVPQSEQTTDPVSVARRRLEDLVTSAEGLVDRDTLDWVGSLGSEMAIFADDQLVPCHRDFSPRNWLVTSAGGELSWALIDFERSRLDFPYIDFLRMEFDHWLERPERREAFFAGYGRQLTPDEERKLRLTIVGNCLGTIPWGAKHGDRRLRPGPGGRFSECESSSERPHAVSRRRAARRRGRSLAASGWRAFSKATAVARARPPTRATGRRSAASDRNATCLPPTR